MPDAKFGLTNASDSDAGETAVARINQLNAALQALGAGTIKFDKVGVLQNGGAEVTFSDPVAASGARNFSLLLSAGKFYLRSFSDDWATATERVRVDLASGVVTVPAGKLVDGIRTVRGSIQGSVTSTGAILYGSGFTVNRSNTGVYAVTFTTAFAAPPLVRADPRGGGGTGTAVAGIDSVMVGTPTTTGFSVEASRGGTDRDMNFTFEAKEF